jgi:hypothetical protein
MKRTPSDEYLEKANLLNEDASERVLSRARSKLMRRLEDRKVTVQEVVAIQLELEDEDLAEWRARMAEIKAAEAKKTEEKKKSKSKKPD